MRELPATEVEEQNEGRHDDLPQCHASVLQSEEDCEDDGHELAIRHKPHAAEVSAVLPVERQRLQTARRCGIDGCTMYHFEKELEVEVAY